ncbi:hypothetical protein C0J52_03526 [Blattella germanica]|nr:hypothetical protein C0J52_03526 [Blattella germanica]
MNCVDGRGYVFDCPEGLAFNQDSYRCDWPDQVESCDAEAFLGFTCPEAPAVFGDDYRFYRHPQNCQKYFICVNGRPRLYGCGDGYAFNEDFGGCDGIENVTAWSLEHSKNTLGNFEMVRHEDGLYFLEIKQLLTTIFTRSIRRNHVLQER